MSIYIYIYRYSDIERKFITGKESQTECNESHAPHTQKSQKSKQEKNEARKINISFAVLM